MAEQVFAGLVGYALRPSVEQHDSGGPHVLVTVPRDLPQYNGCEA